MALADDAIARIRSLIIEGRLAPGDRLPHEHRLAEELGISRNSTREAVRALEQARVLEVRQGSGTYVTSLDPALLLQGVALAVDLMRDDTLLEVLEVRQMLEPVATARAVAVMDDDKLLAIRRALDSVGPDSSVDELVAADIRFHAAVAAATGNSTLRSILDGLGSRTVHLRIWHGVVSADATARTIAAHESIYEALAQRDPALAHASALVHLRDAASWLRTSLGDERDEPEAPASGRKQGRPPVSTVATTA
ncbi:FadR/GntR family transcriptional regulator [Lentzea sp. JNUCC 0626]|uniref:FadR/GntR family transcriptional regulator n=1 Tax=Lentzea sp. JNUCC 0626 TaxID=3367513 RepID=UPI00374A0726